MLYVAAVRQTKVIVDDGNNKRILRVFFNEVTYEINAVMIEELLWTKRIIELEKV